MVRNSRKMANWSVTIFGDQSLYLLIFGLRRVSFRKDITSLWQRNAEMVNARIIQLIFSIKSGFS